MIVHCDDVTCAVCGHTDQLPSVGHWEAKGAWGLDGRPPEPMLSHLDLLVQVCPGCGYCAEDVSIAAGGVAEIVRSDAYQALRQRRDTTNGCLRFLLQGHIAESQGRIIDAAWAHIHAAWQLEKQDDGARSCGHRLVAADLLKRGDPCNPDGFEKPGVIFLLRCDLLRRAGHFEEAREAALAGLALRPASDDEAALRYELKLIDEGDSAFR